MNMDDGWLSRFEHDEMRDLVLGLPLKAPDLNCRESCVWGLLGSSSLRARVGDELLGDWVSTRLERQQAGNTPGIGLLTRCPAAWPQYAPRGASVAPRTGHTA